MGNVTDVNQNLLLNDASQQSILQGEMVVEQALIYVVYALGLTWLQCRNTHRLIQNRSSSKLLVMRFFREINKIEIHVNASENHCIRFCETKQNDKIQHTCPTPILEK